jgi:NADH/NAD ratio-sensing transcriptional regulator Rex
VRKDFAYFASAGVRGGYCPRFSTDRRRFSASQVWEVALVGAGHLSWALTAYRG